MKSLILVAFAVAFVLPLAALAAYNDVVLTTDADITVNGVQLDVSGSSANIESLTAGSGNFTATLQAGSSFKVASPTLRKINYSISGGSVSVEEGCLSAGYAVKFYLPSGAAATVTVTPDPNTIACFSGGGGGGGGGAPPPPPPPPPPLPPPPTQPPVAPPDRQALIVAIQAQIIQVVQQVVQQIQQMIQQLLSQLLSQLSQQLPVFP